MKYRIKAITPLGKYYGKITEAESREQIDEVVKFLATVKSYVTFQEHDGHEVIIYPEILKNSIIRVMIVDE